MDTPSYDLRTREVIDISSVRSQELSGYQEALPPPHTPLLGPSHDSNFPIPASLLMIQKLTYWVKFPLPQCVQTHACACYVFIHGCGGGVLGQDMYSRVLSLHR